MLTRILNGPVQICCRHREGGTAKGTLSYKGFTHLPHLVKSLIWILEPGLLYYQPPNDWRKAAHSCV